MLQTHPNIPYNYSTYLEWWRGQNCKSTDKKQSSSYCTNSKKSIDSYKLNLQVPWPIETLFRTVFYIPDLISAPGTHLKTSGCNAKLCFSFSTEQCRFWYHPYLASCLEVVISSAAMMEHSKVYIQKISKVLFPYIWISFVVVLPCSSYNFPRETDLQYVQWVAKLPFGTVETSRLQVRQRVAKCLSWWPAVFGCFFCPSCPPPQQKKTSANKKGPTCVLSQMWWLKIQSN